MGSSDSLELNKTTKRKGYQKRKRRKKRKLTRRLQSYGSLSEKTQRESRAKPKKENSSAKCSNLCKQGRPSRPSPPPLPDKRILESVFKTESSRLSKALTQGHKEFYQSLRDVLDNTAHYSRDDNVQQRSNLDDGSLYSAFVDQHSLSINGPHNRDEQNEENVRQTESGNETIVGLNGRNDDMPIFIFGSNSEVSYTNKSDIFLLKQVGDNDNSGQCLCASCIVLALSIASLHFLTKWV